MSNVKHRALARFQLDLQLWKFSFSFLKTGTSFESAQNLPKMIYKVPRDELDYFLNMHVHTAFNAYLGLGIN